MPTSHEIVSVIRQLDKAPERQLKIRHTSVTQCLLNHDWVYRWESVLNLAGMQPLPKMQARKRALKDLFAKAEEDYVERQTSGVR